MEGVTSETAQSRGGHIETRTNTDGVTSVLAHSRTGSLPSPHKETCIAEPAGRGDKHKGFPSFGFDAKACGVVYDGNLSRC
jgi:hypothetical protein